MICKNCGTEFNEGIFCPECGVQNCQDDMNMDSVVEQESILKKREEIVEQEKQRLILEKELKEQEEKVKKEEVERLKSEKEAVEAQKQLEREQEKRRSYAGVTYRTEEEAISAREDNEKINMLKQRLLSTNKQKERKLIFEEFSETITNPIAKQRLEQLKIKVNKKYPIHMILNWVLDGLVLCGMFSILAAGFLDPDTYIGNFIFSIIVLLFCIAFFLILPAIGWTIFSIVKMCSKSYYKNIKHI